MAVEISKPALLLVEGKEDELFFGAFAKHLKLNYIQVANYAGKNNLGPYLKQLVISPAFLGKTVTSLGVARDADSNPQGAFQSVCGALRGAGLPEPKAPLQILGDSPRVSVMILPAGDVTTPGMLEDVCLSAVSGIPAMTCVEQYFACLQEQGLPLPGEVSKARVQTYLASQEPELRLGEAAEAGYWDWEHRAFEQVKAFLQQIAT